MFLKPKVHHNVSDIIILGLATWRASQAIVYERGPYDILIKIREATGITHNSMGERISWDDQNVFSCIWCMSVWVSLILSFMPPIVRMFFAGSAISILIEESLTKKVNSNG